MEFSQNDDYLVCDDCGKHYINGECPDHGPLEWIDDCQPASETQQSNQARFTLPNNLYLMPSAVGQGQMGVFTKARIEKRVIFGPFKGQKIFAKEFPLGKDHNFMHMWDILEGGKVSHIIDGSDEQNSNWMRFVNCACDSKEQNLVAVQFRGEIYYKTCIPMESGAELLVWYRDSVSLKKDSLTNKDGHDYVCDICGLVFPGSNFLLRHKTVRCPGRSADQSKTSYDNTAEADDSEQSSAIDKANDEDSASPVEAESLYVVDIGTTSNGINSTVVEEDSRYVRVLQLEPASSSRASKRGKLKQDKQFASVANGKTTRVTNTRKRSAQSVRKAKQIAKESTVTRARRTASSNITKAHNTLSRKTSVSAKITAPKAKRKATSGTKGFNPSNSRRGRVKRKKVPSEIDKSQVRKKAKKSRNSVVKSKTPRSNEESESNADEDVSKEEKSSGKASSEPTEKSKAQRSVKKSDNSKSSSSRKRPSEEDEGTAVGKETRRKRTASADKPVFTCEQCSRTFKWKSQLNYHMRSHAKVKEFVCSFCEKRLSQLSSLKRHLRVHSGEKPYGCEECGKRFVEKGKLTLHLRKHTGEPLEKKYKCSECDRGFTLSANLRTHMRTHTGEKPYSCPQCGKGFKRSSDIVSHLRSHTGERPYKCSHCEKCFTMISHRNRHEVIHTGQKPFKCDLCGKGFTQPNSVKAHLKVHERRQAKFAGKEIGQEKQAKTRRDGEMQTDLRPVTDDIQEGVPRTIVSGRESGAAGNGGEKTEESQGVVTELMQSEHLPLNVDSAHQEDSENMQTNQEADLLQLNSTHAAQPEDVHLNSANVEGIVEHNITTREEGGLTTIATEQLELSCTAPDQSTSEELKIDNTLVNAQALLQIGSAAQGNDTERAQLELTPSSEQDQPQRDEGNETTLLAL